MIIDIYVNFNLIGNYWRFHLIFIELYLNQTELLLYLKTIFKKAENL